MYQNQIDDQILSQLRSMSKDQKENLLDFMEHMPRRRHSAKLYRRKAMKQIREAISLQD